MATKIGIIKAAVIRAGGEPPQSLTDDSDDVIAAVALYDSIVTEFLTAHAWTFATRWEEVAVTVTAPPEPYKSEYAIPAECINVRDLRDQYGAKVAFEIIENVIWTYREDDAALTLIYNWWPSETRWPADFAACIEEEMLGRLLGAFEERIRSLEIREVAARKLAKAIQRDARQNPPRKFNNAPLLRAWRGYNVDRT